MSTINVKLKTKILQRIDTESNWNTNNPILSDGELVFVRTDDGKVLPKIGQGMTYSQTPFQTNTTIDENLASSLNFVHISQDDYNQLVIDGECLSNTVYVVSSDYIEAYGEQIKNLAPATDLSDAVTLQQLNSVAGGAAKAIKINGTTTSADSNGLVDLGTIQAGVTAVKVNGVTKSPSSGVVDIGTAVSAVKLNGTSQTVTTGSVNLTGVALTSQLNTVSTALSTAISNKSTMYIDDGSSVSKSDMRVVDIALSDYEDMVVNNQVEESCLYLVSAEYIDSFGMQVKDVAQATDLSDAVPLWQVSSMIQSALTAFAAQHNL